MRFFNKIKGLKLVAVLAAMATCLAASAQNEIYIEPFTISDYEPVDVPVYLNNDVEILALQFAFQLPEQLEIVEGSAVANKERLDNGQVLTAKDRAVTIMSPRRKAISGNKGAIMTIKMRVKNGIPLDGETTLGLDKIVLTDMSLKSINLPAEETTVTLGQKSAFTLSSDVNDVVVTPGKTFPLQMSMTNNFELAGLHFVMTMPEGFSVNPDDIVMSDRVKLGAAFQTTDRGNGVVSFEMVNWSMLETTLAEAGEGPLFTLNVSVPESFTAADATILFNDINASTSKFALVKQEGDINVKIVNGAKYLSDAEEVVAGLRTSLTEALASIAETCPDVKDNFTGAEITTSIDAIDEAAKAAAADNTLPSTYDAVVTQPAAAVTAAIAKLIEDAQAAQAAFKAEADRVAANEAAYKTVTDEIAALQAKLDEMNKTVAETYPGIDVTAESAAAQEAINNLKTAAEAAYKAVETEGTYDYKVDATAADAAIAAIETAAKAAKAEADRVAANEAAYKAVTDEIAALQAKLDEMNKTVAETYPGIDVTAESAAAQEAINKLTTEAEAAYKAVETEGAYDYTVDATAVDAAIAAIETAAKAGQAEVDRVAANEKAYKAVTDEIASLQASLDAMKQKVAETYPGINVEAQVSAAQAAIDKATAEAAAAFEAVATEGVFSYTVDAEGINALIAAIESAAKLASDEAARVAANEAAYKTVSDEIAALQAKLDAMKQTVAETYPGIKVPTEETAAQAAIDKAQAEAAAAFEAVATEGVFSYTVDAEAIDALIAAIDTAAKAAYDEAARVAANEKAYNASLDEIKRMADKLESMKMLVAVTYPKVNVDKEIAAAQEAIDKAKADAAAAFEAVATEGEYNYTVDTAAIEALIDAIRKAAVDAQAALEAEAARVAANEAAYQAVLNEIAALQGKLDNMKMLVNVSYPTADVTAETAAAQEAIDQAKADAAAALEAVADEGNFDYTVDAKAIEALIDEILVAAKNSGITDIEVETANGVKYFNLQGVRIVNPEKGMMLIRVTPDGKSEKVVL